MQQSHRRPVPLYDDAQPSKPCAPPTMAPPRTWRRFLRLFSISAKLHPTQVVVSRRGCDKCAQRRRGPARIVPDVIPVVVAYKVVDWASMRKHAIIVGGGPVPFYPTQIEWHRQLRQRSVVLDTIDEESRSTCEACLSHHLCQTVPCVSITLR
ncbi:hypothetical protein H310_08535 [Aphanomyces invadans]|uniref:Uncharacterized protein n=1 Tax=Aphanomyces invadans TaxID=157072 RepID=A0A024TZP8_9STRA|nr:hypothetical protein H310_08535 [Aphanomyces invadans]ETV99126.1 hypothetical protein H310_08535 [Aphanomyces invadans]|eukprot:XP_008872554.1 hypothetical protein H310_08535 [Aphanomyces invadans]